MDCLGGALTLAGDRRCLRCGHLNRELAHFCRECGASLQGASQQESTDGSHGLEPEPAASDVRATPSTREPAPGTKRGWSLKAPVIVPVAVALLGGALVVAGWQADWPPAVFGVRHAAAVQQVPASSAPASAPATAVSGVSSPPAVSNSAGPQIPTASPPPGPAIIVEEYFAAISSGDYARAWRLGGRNFSPSYAAYVAGFQGTVNDVITIISVEGRVVTARLAAHQADGSTKKYEGEYTVIHGVIAKSSVQQLP